MSGDMNIRGRIVCYPPISYDEVLNHPKLMDFAFRTRDENPWPGAVVRTQTLTVSTKYGNLAVKVGTSIVGADYETNGSELLEDVSRIVKTFRTAPTGKVRTWRGYLECFWANEEVFRIYVDPNGTVTEVKPYWSGCNDPLPPDPKEVT